MSTAICPCCGNKEPVPDGRAGRRITCSNCDTPFVPTVAPQPPAAPPKRTTPAPPSRRPHAEPVAADVKIVPAAAPQPQPVPEPRRAEQPPGPGVPAAAPSPTRTLGRPATGLLLLAGLGAFGAVLLCGGITALGYVFLRPPAHAAGGGATSKEDGTGRAPPAEAVAAANADGPRAVDFRPIDRPKERETPVPEVMKGLHSPEVNVRLEAANTLAARGPAAALSSKQLGELLNDKEPAVRLAAARALGQIGPAAHVAYPALLHALGDSDAAARQAVQEALTKVGNPVRDDVPDLGAALKDLSPAVRGFALETLAKLELDPETVAPLYASAAKDEDKALRLKAVQALAKLGPKGRKAALPALLGVLQDADPDVRKAATEAMGAMGQAAAGDLPALRAALKAKASPAAVRASAARQLATLGPAAKDAVPELTEALKDGDVTVRRGAAAALARVGAAGKAVLVVLIEALGDKDPEVCRDVLEALGKLGAGAKAATPTVAEKIKNPDAGVRKAAGQALAAIDPDAAPAAYAKALFAADDKARLDAAEFLVGLGAKAKPRMPELIAALDDKNPAVRVKVAQVIAQVDPTTSVAVRTLAKLLTNDDQGLRLAASAALAVFGAVAQDALDELRGVLKDRDPDVRRNAVAALAKLGPKARKATPELIAALADPKLHEPIGELLVKFGPDLTVPRLVRALRDKEPAVRRGAALALGKFGADAREALGALSDSAIEAEKDPDVKKAMRRARQDIIRPAP